MIKIGIFSGRFDPPNAGHFMTIERLIEEYHFLLVPVLNYEGREACSAGDAVAIFNHHFDRIIPKMFKNRVKFVINDEHFGKITAEELHELLKKNDLLFNGISLTYLAGNQEVLTNIKNIGINCEFVPRVTVMGVSDQYLFESTRIRKHIKKTGKTLGEVYNIDTKT